MTKEKAEAIINYVVGWLDDNINESPSEGISEETGADPGAAIQIYQGRERELVVRCPRSPKHGQRNPYRF